jgi:hypothetical protein
VIYVIVQLEAENDSTGMGYTPAVVRRAVGMGYTARQAQDGLVALARAGLVELRPESGLGRLSAADAALCPAVTDPMTDRPLPLSWVRVV